MSLFRYCKLNFSTEALTKVGGLEVVAKLRSETSLSLKMCRKAALDADFDYDKAKKILLGNALAGAEKLRGDSSLCKEGIFAVSGDERRLAIAQVRCETDFVSMNTEIQELAVDVAQAIQASSKPAWSLLHEKDLADVQSRFISVEEAVKEKKAKFGENIAIGQSWLASVNSENETLSSYIHQKSGPNLGKLVTVVSVESSDKNDEHTRGLASAIARHLAATKTKSGDIQSLLSESYVFDEKYTVGQLLEKHRDNYGKTVFVKNFIVAAVK